MRLQPPPDSRRSPIVPYALILGLLAIGAIFFSTQYGRSHENPKPSAVSSPTGTPTPPP